MFSSAKIIFQVTACSRIHVFDAVVLGLIMTTNGGTIKTTIHTNMSKIFIHRPVNTKLTDSINNIIVIYFRICLKIKL